MRFGYTKKELVAMYKAKFGKGPGKMKKAQIVAALDLSPAYMRRAVNRKSASPRRSRKASASGRRHTSPARKGKKSPKKGRGRPKTGMTVAMLRAELKAKGLVQKGNRAALMKRLSEAKHNALPATAPTVATKRKAVCPRSPKNKPCVSPKLKKARKRLPRSPTKEDLQKVAASAGLKVSGTATQLKDRIAAPTTASYTDATVKAAVKKRGRPKKSSPKKKASPKRKSPSPKRKSASPKKSPKRRGRPRKVKA